MTSRVRMTSDRVCKTGRALSNEVMHYRAMEAVPPPFTAPKLIGWDGETLVLTRLEGAPLGTAKVLGGDIPGDVARACVALVGATSRWQSPVDGVRFDYRKQLEWGAATGLLDVEATSLLGDVEVGADRVFQHGDLVPPNVLVHESRLSVLDFEWSGRFAVDGLDWSRLLVNTWDVMSLRRRLLDARLAHDLQGMLNWAAVICHELRQLDRDGADKRWASDSRRMYLSQIPLLRNRLSEITD